MSTKIDYNGVEIANFSNDTKTLTCAGKVMVSDVTVTDVGGWSGTIIPKTITENGTYNASTDNTDGYSPVVVNVPGIVPTGNKELTQQTGTDVTNYATASVRNGSVTLNMPTINTSTGVITSSASIGTTGWIGSAPSSKTLSLSTQAAKTVTPTTSEQMVVDAGKYTTGEIKVAAMPMATHSAPTASIDTSTGVVTASHTQSSGYVAGGTTTGTLVLSTQAAKTVTPTSSSQTAVSAGKYTTGAITVAAVPTETKSITSNGTYTPTSGKFFQSVTVNVPTGTQRTVSDVTVSGATVSVPAGLYGSAVSKSVASGSAGTPTATKGSVSNHSITVTPQVTNTTGYITGDTKTGSGVTVSASELVSGSETKTENGTYDVTNLASVVVNVSGGGVPLPSTITPGDTPIWIKSEVACDTSNSERVYATYTVRHTGTYKIVMYGRASSRSYGKSGVKVNNINAATGTFSTSTSGSNYDITVNTTLSLTEGDIVEFWYNSGSTTYSIVTVYAALCINWNNTF